MKKITILSLMFLLGCSLIAPAQKKDKDKKEEKEGYVFTDIKRMPTTSVKSQDRSSTCWCWSTLSFFESEIIRQGKDSVSLSPMFVVWNTYNGKGEKYVRMHGDMPFPPGGAAYDVQWAIENFGIVPFDVYQGLEYGEDKHVHGELNALLNSYADVIVKNPNRKISPVWQKGYQGILNTYLGEKPEKFNYKGKEYTPQSFTKEVGLDMDNYIQITSFSHHPFYESFPIEVPDNWLWGTAYNLPLDVMMDVLDKAIDNGYTFAWGADISEKGFGGEFAVVPTIDTKEMNGSDMAKWLKLSAKDQEAELYKFDKPGKEKVITQELRQEEFDNYKTTDDHGMHIMGKAKDQAGNPYFIVKNSWGPRGKYNGYFYASYPFVAFKTTSIMINKNALSKELQQKLGIK